MGLEVTLEKLFQAPRSEIKFICDFRSSQKLLNYFKRYGFVKSFPRRTINSIYFDDRVFSSAHDNLAGVSPRSKFRLRWYTYANLKSDGWKFEEKIKIDELGYKQITVLDVKKFEKNILPLIKLANRVKDCRFTQNSNSIEPKLFCSYQRDYYEDKDGLRLTFDSNICFRLPQKNLNDVRDTIKKRFPLSTNLTVVEFKYGQDGRVRAQKISRNVPHQAMRCSKYLLGLSKTRGIQYI